MDYKTLLDELYSDPKISFYFSLLKTSKWRELKKSEKAKFFIKFHNYIASKLDLYQDVLAVDTEHIDKQNSNNEKTMNVSYKDPGVIYIQDIFYNQYLTLYEYFCIIMQKYQKRQCFMNKDDNDSLKEWKRNLRSFSFGSAEINYLMSEENCSDYQTVNRDALTFAREMVFEIVKKNFDYEDSHDEQYFMSNSYVLVNDDIIRDGRNIVDLVEQDKMNEEQRLKIIENKIMMLDDNLEEAKDEDLFLVIYPSISNEIDILNLVDIYNEIISRIYDNSVFIRTSKNSIKIGNNSYNYKKFFDNHFNIIIRECLNDMDNNLRNDEMFLNSELVKEKGIEEAIFNYKKNWFYKTILYIDRKLLSIDFSIIKYQPLYRLVNKECLEKNIKKTTSRR